MDISDIGSQLRARLQNNQFLVSQLSNTDDRRVKRIIELLGIASQQDVTLFAEEIHQIVGNLPGKVGFHPRLQFLISALFKAADYLEESLTRVSMYLDHMSATGSTLPEAIRLLVDSAVQVQMDLSATVCQRARSAYADAICYPPGPGARLDGKPNTDPDSRRELRDGEPHPIGKDHDPRWDPFVRMPGSQHGKFFKFPGPFFAPDTTRTNFDHFFLSETHSSLIDNTNRKIAHVRANLEKTGRVKPKEKPEEDAAASATPQPEDDFDVFAEEHGYDLDAVVLHTLTAPRNIADAIAPYVDNHQVKRSSIATGLVQPEDLNRAIQVMEGGRWRGIIRPVEVGCQVVLDQRISRSHKNET